MAIAPSAPARVHGSLVEVAGVGVLLLGKSGIGKSECALELVMRGHRLVADDIGMHESTVSRVTTAKYVQTPHGLFELKFFFNSSIRTGDGEGIASESVKEKIMQIIKGEDPRNPLSDQKIAEMLSDSSIEIARRTVTKYREALRILSSTRRRQIG